jgi:hypothetical protein
MKTNFSISLNIGPMCPLPACRRRGLATPKLRTNNIIIQRMPDDQRLVVAAAAAAGLAATTIEGRDINSPINLSV